MDMKTIQKPKRMWQKRKDYNKKKLIRKIQRRNKVSFDDGKDRSYQDWKTKASKYKHIDIDRDNTYDYEGWYNSDPDNAYNFLNNDPEAHFDDAYKTVYHPTFSDLSIYSGKIDPRFNPEGLEGGHWVNDHKYISPKKSPVSMDERINYVNMGEDNGLQIRTPENKPLWMDDGTRYDGVLPNVIVKPKRISKRADFTKNDVRHNSGKDVHIKKANRGKFIEAANEHNMGVQEFARQVLSAPKGKYSPTLRKRANFARNFAH